MKQIGYQRQARSHAVEVKGAFWGILGALVLIGYALWATLNIYSNRQYTALGKAVDCVERPSFEYFSFCNPQADGPACGLASQSRMMHFYEPIDYACAQFEPKRTFVFRVVDPEREPLEVADNSG